jgi:sulfate adenylyltransferase subunit 1
MEDQLEALERSADITGGGQINLANLTDGLRAEREQGITIDVAYRYFATPRRKFIVADTPGHVQYTRNMVTGASTANLSIILVDARAGVIEQSRRHTAIASLLRIPHLVIAVNKMDLVGWSEARFNEIRASSRSSCPGSTSRTSSSSPSARSTATTSSTPRSTRRGTRDPPCSATSRPCTSRSDWNLQGFRLPVQWVNRPNNPTDARSCTISAASAARSPAASSAPVQKVMVLPAGTDDHGEGNPHLRRSGARGVLSAIHHPRARARHRRQPRQHDHWARRPARRQHRPARQGLLDAPARAAAREKILAQAHDPHRPGRDHRGRASINISTLEQEPAPAGLAMNDIGEIRLRTSKPARVRRLRHQPADRLFHSHRAGHPRDRRRRHAASAQGSGPARRQRLRDPSSRASAVPSSS